MKGQSQCWAILTCWVLILNLTLYYRLVYQGFTSVNQLWFIHIWAIIGFQWMMHGYVLGHITPQQHVLFSIWNLYNKLGLATHKSWIGAPFLPFELVGFTCVFFGLLVSMVFPSNCMFIDLDWMLQMHSCTIYVFWLTALVIWCRLVCVGNKVW
jgi:hypothetical protein